MPQTHQTYRCKAGHVIRQRVCAGCDPDEPVKCPTCGRMAQPVK